MKKLKLFQVCVLLASTSFAQLPASWSVTGIGGGGAFFAPTLNPANPSEIFISSDMSGVYHTTNNGASWSLLNAQQIQGGHNSTVRFTLTPGLLYAVSYANNLIQPVKSTDGGQTWSMLPGTPYPYDEVYNINVDYNDGIRIVLGYYGEIFFSDDGGNTFKSIHTAVSMGSGCLVGGVFFDGNNIHIGTNDGIIFSNNGGTSFSVLPAGGIPTTETIVSFSAAKQNGTTRFFCLTGSVGNVYNGMLGSDYWGLLKGIYVMDNANGTWTQKMNGINTSNDYLVFAGMAENDISTCYLAGSGPDGKPDIMKTTDGGASWTHVFIPSNNQNIITGWCGDGGDKTWTWAECPFGFTVAKNDPSVALFGDYSLVTRTDDGGTTWKQAYVNPSDQHPAGLKTPQKQYYHSVGLENTACWQVFWADSVNMFGAYTDIFTLRSKDAGQSWSYDYAYPMSNTVYRIVKNVSNANILYAATSTIHDLYKSYRLTDAIIDPGGGKIIFSTDKGATWSDMHDFNDCVYWLATDPAHPNRMYASVVNHSGGTGGIYVSNDIQNGASSAWTRLPDPPRTEGHPASINFLSNGNLLCSYSGRRNGNVFTASSGVFLYNTTTSSWTDVSAPELHYYTKDVVVDPSDASQQTWLACVYNGWGGTGNDMGGLYLTKNGGSSWTRILNPGDVSSCTFNPSNPDQLYVATAGNGLWYCSDIHAATPTFTRAGSYPFGSPERIFFNPYDNHEIWIGSFGYGMNVGNTLNSGFDEKTISGSLSLSPNPVSGRLTIVLSDGICERVLILDITGKQVPVEQLTTGKSVTMDVSALPDGLYVVQIVDISGRSNTGKFTKSTK
jgi:photosystem II stability/assembly factor-like uncharacterized protein